MRIVKISLNPVMMMKRMITSKPKRIIQARVILVATVVAPLKKINQIFQARFTSLLGIIKIRHTLMSLSSY